MKGFVKCLMVMGVLAVSSVTTMAASSFDQLYKTKHNFNSTSYTFNAGNTMCQPCHTPHNAILDSNNVQNANFSTRLWNHLDSTATYTLYDGAIATYTAAGATGTNDGNQGMDRVSRLCLGCHDGTVALDAFGLDPAGSGNRNTGSIKFSAGDVNNLDKNFRNDHPVGNAGMFLKPGGAPVSAYLKGATTTTDSGGNLTKATVNVFTGNGTGTGTLSLVVMSSAASGTVDIGGTPVPVASSAVVACRTCHDPHGKGLAEGVPYAHLLVCNPNDLCNSCHYK